jgi:biopolymer transport protein ExbB/TolQ
MPEVCLNSLHADGCPWNFGYLWNSLDWLGRADLCLLALMLVNVLFVACNRLYRYHRAQRQSRAFVRRATSLLPGRRIHQLLPIAEENAESHVASVIRSGLIAFTFAPSQLSNQDALEVAQRALRRTRATTAAELARGLGTLASIASSAPFIGLLGTVYGIMNAFQGTTGSKSAALARLASSLSEALVTAAAGLVVAVPAVWWRNHFRVRVEVFDSEMSNAELETTTYLQAHPEWRNQRESSDEGIVKAIPVNVPSFCEVQYDHHRALLLGAGLCALYFAYQLALAAYLHFIAL